MKNPALVLDVNPAIQMMMSSIYQSGISPELLEYVGLRVGQMNNCELCVNQSFNKGQTNPSVQNRLEDVLVWKKSDKFSVAECSALEITEAVTELKDRYNSVSDSLWSKIKEHYNEKELAALVVFISVMNMFTRINVATRQLTADWE